MILGIFEKLITWWICVQVLLICPLVYSFNKHSAEMKSPQMFHTGGTPNPTSSTFTPRTVSWHFLHRLIHSLYQNTAVSPPGPRHAKCKLAHTFKQKISSFKVTRISFLIRVLDIKVGSWAKLSRSGTPLPSSSATHRWAGSERGKFLDFHSVKNFQKTIDSPHPFISKSPEVVLDLMPMGSSLPGGEEGSLAVERLGEGVP